MMNSCTKRRTISHREMTMYFSFPTEKETSRHLCTWEVCTRQLARVSNFGHYATYQNDIRSLSHRSCDQITRTEGKKRLAVSRLAYRPLAGERTRAVTDFRFFRSREKSRAAIASSNRTDSRAEKEKTWNVKYTLIRSTII